METPDPPHGSEPFDMQGKTGLRVEARLLGVPRHSAEPVMLQVQGTNDGAGLEKNWVVEGHTFTLFPGTWERRTFRGVRGHVRVMTDVYTHCGPGRIEVRLTRLP